MAGFAAGSDSEPGVEMAGFDRASPRYLPTVSRLMSSVSLRVEPASSLRVRITHPWRRNSHVPFHHPLQSPVGEADEKEHARLPEHLCINWWLIRTRKKVGENNPQNDNVQLARNPPVRPAMLCQSQNRMLQAHIEFVHCALVPSPRHSTQCVPQSGWFSFDPHWLVFTVR